GDPAATGAYAVPMIQALLEDESLPIFGICLGHQMLALALGARTVKMNHGHHGANHPVKDNTTGKVEITSMNHGFTVDSQTLPAGVTETHVSLFDGSNCGIAMENRPVFSVQYHPEASPGPMDSYYLFERFAAAMEARG
ncbi:MAG: gamma-glutamyl-gamma-aminobutyrate hydrolase family protein, partial [Maritimibacter sp.]|nr:gamma-glutamyl-gamma-aminobutyrate hydrolase family protein [Maritimibacter sp.]